jgi:hypothetical protein
LQTFERLPIGVNKIIEKDHTIISHDASLQPGADEVRYFGRSYEAFWPHRGVEAVIYRLCNPRRNSVDATIVAHDGRATDDL